MHPPSRPQNITNNKKLSWLEKANFRIFEPLEVSYSFIKVATAIKQSTEFGRAPILKDVSKPVKAEPYKLRVKLPAVTESPHENKAAAQSKKKQKLPHEENQFIADRLKKRREFSPWLVPDIDDPSSYFVHSLYVCPYWSKVSVLL